MSTPVIVEARRLWPDARIVLLGNRQTCALLAACPLIDECVESPAVPFTLRKKRRIADLELWLKNSDFDLALILLGDEFAQVLANARIPERVGVRGDRLAPFLTRTYDIGSARDWGPPERLGALRALGHDVHNVGPRLWVDDGARAAAHATLLELGLPRDAEYAVLHPFGSTAPQRWPATRISDLARVLRDEHDLRTVVVGGPETRGSLPPCHGDVIDSTGALSIAELLAVIDGARVVISTDSGPFHIAGALGRPLVGMFRSRRPEHAGRYPQADVVFGRHDACNVQCRWNRCRTLPCRQMQSLPIDDVVGSARRILFDEKAGLLTP